MKPHILICGQKGRRIEEFRLAFGTEARLAFHEPGTNVRRLGDQPREH